MPQMFDHAEIGDEHLLHQYDGHQANQRHVKRLMMENRYADQRDREDDKLGPKRWEPRLALDRAPKHDRDEDTNDRTDPENCTNALACVPGSPPAARVRGW